MQARNWRSRRRWAGAQQAQRGKLALVETTSWGLWYAAREGNVARMEYLIVKEQVNVNRTRWSGIADAPRRRGGPGGGHQVPHETRGRHPAEDDLGVVHAAHLACGRGKLGRGCCCWSPVPNGTRRTRRRAPIEWAISKGHRIIARRLDAKYMAMEAAKKDSHEELMKQQAEAARRREVEEKERREAGGGGKALSDQSARRREKR